MATERIDYLDTDPAVAGQTFCCISFVSPASLVEQRELFYVEEFLKAEAARLGIKEVDDIVKRYADFKFTKEPELLNTFQERYPTRSTVHALKIRGSYPTLEQAKDRASYLQKIDPDFNVFVGQVGYWLPWNPRSDQMQDEVFLEDQMNELIGKYKENVRKTDEFYRAETQRRIDDARREGQAGREAMAAIDATSSSVSVIDNALQEAGPSSQQLLEILDGSEPRSTFPGM